MMYHIQYKRVIKNSSKTEISPQFILIIVKDMKKEVIVDYGKLKDNFIIKLLTAWTKKSESVNQSVGHTFSNG